MRIPTGPALRPILRWGLGLALVAAGFGLLLAWPAPPPLAFRPEPRSSLKPDPRSGLVTVIATVVPGTSRFEPSDSGCTHRLEMDTAKGLRLRVELPYCWVIDAFHRAEHLEVLAEGRLDGDRLIASRLEPQLGHCCGGPHCYR